MKISRPSITLKCGSAKSFFMARLRTSGDTSRATKALKSDAGVSAWASASVGGGGASAAGAAPSAAVGGAPAATEDGLGGDDEDAAGGNDGAGGGGSSTCFPFPPRSEGRRGGEEG